MVDRIALAHGGELGARMGLDGAVGQRAWTLHRARPVSSAVSGSRLRRPFRGFGLRQPLRHLLLPEFQKPDVGATVTSIPSSSGVILIWQPSRLLS